MKENLVGDVTGQLEKTIHTSSNCYHSYHGQLKRILSIQQFSIVGVLNLILIYNRQYYCRIPNFLSPKFQIKVQKIELSSPYI